MTSKWIEELHKEFDKDVLVWEDLLPILLRIDGLFRKAMYRVDSDILYDQMHEQVGVNPYEELLDTKKFTGVSSVVPVTEDEALRIMREVEDDDED